MYRGSDEEPAKRMRLDADAMGSDDVFEQLAKRGSMLEELEAEVRKARRYNRDLQDQLAAKTQEAAALQSEAAIWKSIKETERNNMMQTNTQLNQQLSEQILRAKTLEGQLSHTQAEWAATKAELERVRVQAESASEQLQRLSRVTAASSEELQALLASTQRDALRRQQQLEGELAVEQQRRAGEAEAHAATQQQLSAAQATMRSQQQQLADLNARLSSAEGRAAAAEAAAAGLGTAELKIMLSSLQEQLAAQKAELAVARKVKHEADAAARLQGELLVAKQEAAGAAAALAQLKEQHRSSEELREEVDRWRLLFKKYTGADHPSPFALTKLHTELVSTQDQLRTVQGELNALKEQQQEMWAQHQEATTAANSAKSALAAAQRQVAVLEAQVVPLQREREGLTRLVDVLQKGLADQAGAHITSSSSQQQSNTAGDASDAVVAGVTSERIQLLEQAVKDLTSQQELLQEQYKAAGQAEAQQRQRADAAERASAALERQVEALSQQCAQQQARLGAGDHDPSRSRVLHLIANPEAELARLGKEQALERLTAENTALRSQLQALTSAGGGGGAGSQVSLDVAVKEAELAVLTKRLDNMTRGQQRLQEMFKTRIATFRSAVKHLFGYKLEMTAEAAPDMSAAPSTLKLVPCLPGAALEGMLLFRYTPGEGLQLLPTPLSERLAAQVDTYITRFACVPAFTANLTIEAFGTITR